jgi:hypothetical protein
VTTTVVIPWRDRGDPDRAANRAAVFRYLQKTGVGTIIEASDGRDRHEPFNRSAAYNRGMSQLPADVYVFCEADLLVPARQLQDAVRVALLRPGLVVPFSVYRYLNLNTTRRVRDWGADPFTAVAERTMADRTSVGACNVVSAETMRLVGCWDETFDGWGYDDRAMCHAFTVASGTRTRFITGPAVHLWHPPGWQAGQQFAGGGEVSERERAATARNKGRYRRYVAARDPYTVRRLTSGQV